MLITTLELAYKLNNYTDVNTPVFSSSHDDTLTYRGIALSYCIQVRLGKGHALAHFFPTFTVNFSVYTNSYSYLCPCNILLPQLSSPLVYSKFALHKANDVQVI